MKCSLCGKDDFRFIFEGNDRLYQIPGNFRIFKCKDCGLIFVYPCPDSNSLAKYYPDNYYSYSDSRRAELKQKKKFIQFFRNPFRFANSLAYSKILGQNWLPKLKNCANILDIGCGDGRFLLEMQAKGHNCYGVDINKAATEKLKQDNYKIKIFCGNIWEAQFADNYFDYINVSNVIEHVPDFSRFLSEIRRIVKPGTGIIKILTPNAASLTRKIFNQYWIGLDVPRHLHVFSLENLKTLIKNNSFTYRFKTMENSFDFLVSLIYIINKVFKKNIEALKAENFWDNEIIKLILAPYCLIVNAFKIGDVAEFILKKEE